VGEANERRRKWAQKLIFEERSRQLIESKGPWSERTRKRTRRGGLKAVNLLKIGEINEAVAKPKRGFWPSILFIPLLEDDAREWQKTVIIGQARSIASIS
jgi:hypothetical protein